MARLLGRQVAIEAARSDTVIARAIERRPAP